MKKIKIAACILGLAISASSWAHVGLKEASPAQDAILMESPNDLSLTFSAKVRLIKLSVSTDTQSLVEFGFTPSAEASVMYESQLPNLLPGSYDVNWVALGEDGHKMSGQYQFTLHKQGKIKDMPAKKASHNEH